MCNPSQQKWTIENAFETTANSEVLAFLKRSSPSAHSDLVDVLRLAGQGAPGAHFYCPDTKKYAFYAAHRTDYTIFALAIGMRQLVFHLPAGMRANALQEGGTPFTGISSEWISFHPSSKEEYEVESRQRLSYWFRKALLSNAKK